MYDPDSRIFTPPVIRAQIDSSRQSVDGLETYAATPAPHQSPGRWKDGATMVFHHPQVQAAFVSVSPRRVDARRSLVSM